LGQHGQQRSDASFGCHVPFAIAEIFIVKGIEFRSGGNKLVHPANDRLQHRKATVALHLAVPHCNSDLILRLPFLRRQFVEQLTRTVQ